MKTSLNIRDEFLDRTKRHAKEAEPPLLALVVARRRQVLRLSPRSPGTHFQVSKPPCNSNAADPLERYSCHDTSALFPANAESSYPEARPVESLEPNAVPRGVAASNSTLRPSDEATIRKDTALRYEHGNACEQHEAHEHDLRVHPRYPGHQAICTFLFRGYLWPRTSPASVYNFPAMNDVHPLHIRM